MKRIIDFFLKYPWRVLSFSILLSLVALLFSFRMIRINTDWVSLAPQSQYLRLYKEIQENFNISTPIFIMLKGKDRKALNNFINKTIMDIEKKMGKQVWIDYKINRDFFMKYGVFLMDSKDFRIIYPFIKSGNILYPIHIFNRIIKYTVFSPSKEDKKALVDVIKKDLELLNGTREVEDFFRSISNKENLYTLAIYLKRGSGRMEEEANIAEKIRSIVEGASKDFSGITYGMTGIPVIAQEENSKIRKVAQKSTLLSLLLILLIQVISFRNWKTPFVLLVPLLLGILLTLFFISLTTKRLNLLTSMFIPVLLGLGIDFGIHFVIPYKDLLYKKGDKKEALTGAFFISGKGIFLGALTTSFAFFTLSFSRFGLFREFGIISGVGLLLCMLSILIVLPPLLLITNVNRRKIRGTNTLRRFVPDSKKKSILGLAVIIGITVFLAISASRMRFENDLRSIQPANLTSMDEQDELFKKKGFYPNPILTSVIKDDVETKVKQLKKLLSVGRVVSITDYIPSNDTFKERKEKIKKIRGTRKYDLKKELNMLKKNLVFIKDDTLKEEIETIVDNLLNNNTKKIEENLEEANHYILNWRESLTSLPYPSLSNIPSGIKNMFISKDNQKSLIYIFPAISLWDINATDKLKKDIQTVVKEITGLPLIMLSVSEAIKNNSNLYTIYVIFFILLLLSISLRSPTLGFISVINLVFTLIWSIGILSFLRINMNVVNVFALPLIVGIAIDDSIHILTRYQTGGRKSIAKVLGKTGLAISLTTVTTIVGFGSLIFNPSRGIKTLGIFLCIGFISAFILTIILIPSMINITRRNADE